MQEIEDKIRKVLVEESIKKIILILLFILGVFTFAVLYTFNLDSFYLVAVLLLSLICAGILGYFYFKPTFIREKKKELFLLFVCVLIFFAFMETVLQVTSCDRHYEQFPDADLKHKHEISSKICNQIKDGKRFYAFSNNEGFIDDNFVYKPEDYNIFLLGDSFAQCLQTDYKNCVHQKLEKDLKNVYGDRINIMNFGVGGYGALAELAALRQYKDEYKPKMVILYFLAQNDLSDNRGYFDSMTTSAKVKSFVRELTPKSLLFVMTNGRNILNNILLKSESYRLKSSYGNQAIKDYEVYLANYSESWQADWELELDTLGEIQRICNEDNITLLLVAVTADEQVYPEDWDRILETYPSLKGKTYILDKPNNIVMKFAEEQGIYHLDLLPLFKEQPERLHWTYDGHWNDAGQLFAEEKIKEYILQNNLIK